MTSFIKFHVTYFLTVINIGEGPACSDVLPGAKDETLQTYLLRNYELFKDLNISNGWCSVGKGKRIIFGSTIGKPKDFCICSPLANVGSNVPMTTASAATTSKNWCLCLYQNFNDNIRATYQKSKCNNLP